MESDTASAWPSWDTCPWNLATMVWESPGHIERPQPAEVPANSQHTLPDMWVRHLQMIPAPRLRATPADTMWSCDKLPHPVADLWAKQMIAVVLSQQLKLWGDLLCRSRHPGHTQLYCETTPGMYHQVTIWGKSAQRECSQRPFLLCPVWGLAPTLHGSGCK